tara:strand:- start:1255 stop:1980 length:726 start_codon:yes stop_codon:yes gene_type:complete
MDRRAVDFTPGRGLGNRLLSIAFARAITNVKSINWVKTEECNADFYDLFSAPHLPIVTSDDLLLYAYQDMIGNKSIKKQMHSIIAQAFYQKIRIKNLTHFYTCLRPSTSVASRIIEIPNNTLGIHLRFTDHLQHISEIDFEKSLLKHIDKINPDYIYICSDTLYKKKYFIKMLKDYNLLFTTLNLTNIIKEEVYSPERNHLNGMRSATAELFTLSKCRWILPNSISTFSLTSFFMGDSMLL